MARATSAAPRPSSIPAAGIQTVTPATSVVFWAYETDWPLLRVVPIGAVRSQIDYIFQQQIAAGRLAMPYVRRISFWKSRTPFTGRNGFVQRVGRASIFPCLARCRDFVHSKICKLKTGLIQPNPVT